MNRSLKFIALLVAIISLVACTEHPAPTQVLQIGPRASAGELKTLPVTSDRAYPADREREIKEELVRLVNSGQYNVVGISTTYADTLLRAEIQYEEGFGPGNKLKLAICEKDGDESLSELLKNGYRISAAQQFSSHGKIIAILAVYSPQ